MLGVVIAGHNARSPQLAAAARLLAISWAFSIQLWLVFDGVERAAAFAMADFCLACAFFQMSRRRWFPVPLFFLHAALVIYHIYTIVTKSDVFWIHAFMNRAFEAALIYVLLCSVYRIFVLKIQARS